MQPKASDRQPVVRQCPVCHQPLTKIQRRLNGNPTGSVVWVCARAEQCSLGMNLSKVDTWVAV